MLNGDELLVTGFALLLIAAGAATVSNIQLPGTEKPQGPNQPAECTLKGSIGIEGTGTKIKINEGSLQTKIKESGLFSLSIVSPGTSLSILKAENVEMTYTLSGPESREQKDSLGSVGKLGGSKSSAFKFTDLSQGTYQLDMDLNWNTGSDSFTKTVNVQCGGER
ncbi:MAG: hypothetical protein ABEJ56_05785 [Candidatus Nanohaloarchaea archaeon]